MLDLSKEAKQILYKIAKRVGHPIKPYNIYNIREKAILENNTKLLSLINQWYKSEKSVQLNTDGKESYKLDWVNKEYGG